MKASKNNRPKRIFKSKFIDIYGIKRKTPNELTAFSDALHEMVKEFQNTLIELFRIDQLAKWLGKKLNKNIISKKGSPTTYDTPAAYKNKLSDNK